MSVVGNLYDNAKTESFFKTLKQEEMHLKLYNSFMDAEQILTFFIEKMYNKKDFIRVSDICLLLSLKQPVRL